MKHYRPVVFALVSIVGAGSAHAGKAPDPTLDLAKAYTDTQVAAEAAARSLADANEKDARAAADGQESALRVAADNDLQEQLDAVTHRTHTVAYGALGFETLFGDYVQAVYGGNCSHILSGAPAGTQALKELALPIGAKVTQLRAVFEMATSYLYAQESPQSVSLVGNGQVLATLDMGEMRDYRQEFTLDLPAPSVVNGPWLLSYKSEGNRQGLLCGYSVTYTY